MRLVVNRLLVSSCVAIAAVAVLGCSSDRALEPGTVSGTWTGMVSVTTTTGLPQFTLTLTLLQEGSTVSGTAYSGPVRPDEPDEVSGSMSDGTMELTLTTTPDPTVDDCHLFPVHLTFEVQDAVLVVTGASGTSCEGDGAGGHRALSDVIDASGTLHRR
jgi:hypothetical protein